MKFKTETNLKKIMQVTKIQKKSYENKMSQTFVGQKTCALHEILTRLVITENTFSCPFSNNQLCQYFMESTGFLANQRYSIFFFIFDGKQYPENIWFHGC